MIKEIMLEIIDKKYKELNLDNKDKTKIFWKIQEFEGNAIGQIGEDFIKKMFKEFGIHFNKKRGIIHDEYDIIASGSKIEIKTAKKGLKNNTFQFNGINPRYNYKYLILVGIVEDDIFYKIINKGKIEYIHKERKYFVDLDTNKKQLVKMNPSNEVNFKLTLNIKDMKNINILENELKEIFR